MCYNKSVPLSCTPAPSVALVCSVFESSVMRLVAFFPLCTCHMQERSMDSTSVHRALMLSILPRHDTLQDLGSHGGQDSSWPEFGYVLGVPTSHDLQHFRTTHMTLIQAWSKRLYAEFLELLWQGLDQDYSTSSSNSEH